MSKATILVIDDEQSFLDIITNNLKHYDYKVIQALNGKMGCMVAEKFLPDIIVCDWEMPVMNGIEAIQFLKKQKDTKDIPIIMATGEMTTAENLETALNAGAIDYIRKPIDPIELIARINSSLKLSSSYKAIKKQNEKITAQALHLKEVNLELEKLSIALSKTDNAVVIMDSDTNIEWVNKGFTRLYGYDLDTLIKEIGNNWLIASFNKAIHDAVTFCKTTKKATVYENLNVSRDGKNFWTQTTLTPILDGNNNIQKFIAIDTDITSRKNAEQKIKEQNENIKSSIEYALTIQQAILPFQEEIEKDFEPFIIYRPKDIVSGDFYWYSKTKKNSLSYYFIAAVDCTGHGVPGAFMSMIGNSLLNEIINDKDIFNTDEILNELDNLIRIALNQEKTDNDDGMDICLCRLRKIDGEKIALSFSGAKNSLFYYKHKKKIFNQLKANNKSVGGYIHINKADFTKQEIVLEKGDRIYLYTDGLLDQNNSEGNKFGFNQFKEILEASINLEMTEQKKFIESAFNNHQGDEKQRDDLTLIGLRMI